MAGEWRHHEVDELLAKGVLAVGDGYRAKNDELGHSGLPFCRAGNIQGGFDFADADRYPAGNLARVGDKVSRPGDVVFTSKGTVGRFAFVKNDTEAFVYSPQLCYWRSLDVEVIDPRFLFYWLSGPDFKAQYQAVAGQTDMADYVSLGDQRRMWLRLPNVHEQRAIAHILGTLDEKIELNRRMNGTLEAIARALFKSWFVDFDPVRAKAEGRDTGLPPHLADLFPDSLDNSELGEIPKGWRVAPIGELAVVAGGSTPSTKEAGFWEDGRNHWATPKDLSALATPVLLETERSITDIGLAQIGSGLLPPGTVLLSSRAPIGYLAIAEVPLAINQGFIAMRPAVGVSNLFLLYWAEWAAEEIVSRANGSTFLEISKSNFRRIPVVAPPLQISESFDRVARPAYSRIVANERETRTLISLRDGLLSKLISGEVRVTDAERLVETGA